MALLGIIITMDTRPSEKLVMLTMVNPVKVILVTVLFISSLSATTTSLSTNLPAKNPTIPSLANITLFDTNLFTINFNGTYPENVYAKKNNHFWILFMDRSQLVMTIIGIIANIVTFATLTKNGKVSFNFNPKQQ